MVLCDKKVVQLDSAWGLWEGDIPAVFMKQDAKKLNITWKGKPIPANLFRQILSFFHWTYETFSTEAQLRLYYNRETEEWRAVPMPQFAVSAASSKENEKHENFNLIHAELEAQGFGHAGSGHHHSTMNAFQSETDHKDEVNIEGFHFTIGNITSPVADFHSRCVVREIVYDNFDVHTFLPYNHEILKLTKLPEFPEVWKTRIEKEPAPTIRTFKDYPSQGHEYSGWQEWWKWWNPKNRTPAPQKKTNPSMEDDFEERELEAANRYYLGENTEPVNYYFDDLEFVEEILENIAEEFTLSDQTLEALRLTIEAILLTVEEENIDSTFTLSLYEFLTRRKAIIKEMSSQKPRFSTQP